MTQREEGFERAFSHQEELRFRARARRDRMIGEWAGEKLGLSGPALADFAKALVSRGLDAPNDETLVAQLAKALQPLNMSEHRIRRRLAECAEAAMRDIQAGR
jgi:hypothetical protein